MLANVGMHIVIGINPIVCNLFCERLFDEFSIGKKKKKLLFEFYLLVEII